VSPISCDVDARPHGRSIPLADSRTEQPADRGSTFASAISIFRAELALYLGKAYYLSTGTPDPQALTVKTTVPTLCTPPFPKIQHAELSYARGPTASQPVNNRVAT
jgi:hypothetical protein